MTVTSRVFNPRGQRADGGGLTISVQVSQEEVERFTTPSAVERVTVMRLVRREMQAAERAAEAWLTERALRVLADREAQVAEGVEAGGAGDSQRDGTSPVAVSTDPDPTTPPVTS